MNYQEYSPDWKDIIRPSILKRDNYKCQVCGIIHKSEVQITSRGSYTLLDEFTKAWAVQNKAKITTVYLHVCHIDQDKSNNDPGNLISLCPKHHSLLDAKSKKEKRLSFKRKMAESDKKKIIDFAKTESKKIRELSDIIKEMTGERIKLYECQRIIEFCVNSKIDENDK